MSLQDAEEYAELPVRHNEDQLNSQLAQQLPLQVNPHSYDSAHTKTHLLLQAHFSHAPLPCSDYNTDTKTVLDNTIRICQVGLTGHLQQVVNVKLYSCSWHFHFIQSYFQDVQRT